MLEDYADIIPEEVIENLRLRGDALRGKKIGMVNSTRNGGGVAMILRSLVPLLQDCGVNVTWEVMLGDKRFFEATKKIHNGLQGEKVRLTKHQKQRHKEVNEAFLEELGEYDFYVFHDPQPCIAGAMLDAKKILRCHMDISTPNKAMLEYVKPFFEAYPEIIVSQDAYKEESLHVSYRVIEPATDPFTDINKPIPPQRVKKLVSAYIETSKPVISQISRYDKWKDPLGVIEVFERVREDIDCQLILLGNDASDDPEGKQIFRAVQRRREESVYKDDITVIMENNALLVNAVQRCSDVVLQKSIREGFGLTVSEAMLKRRVVLGGEVGGIPAQIIHGETGFMYPPKNYAAFANTAKNLLRDEEHRKVIGEKARQHVLSNFLLTRLLSDYLSIFEDYLL